MADSVTAVERVLPDYGVDAPGVVRNLVIVGVLGIGLWIGAHAGLWSGRLAFSVGSGRIILGIAPTALTIGVICALMAAYMTWDSKVGKLRERERLLDQVAWIGTERVLDLGCGRGLMLVGAARRIPRGQATGVDIWSATDLSGNDPAATLENARREGVADRVRVETADMRQLPFPSESFDVIVSCSAIHNIYDRTGRDQAIAELVRVLAPGGSAVIDDIRHLAEYERALRARGVTDVTRRGSVLVAWLLAVVTWGSLLPGSVVARKSDAGD